ncbi:MAG: ribosome assembly RNA-binding protein YhbY [Lachnospiraceae bacterium]|nr:ribosome assembly RNA-binding protein YhbY [Lachnospiraceae bacterium]
MTSKQRAYLKSLAMTMDPILYVGKASLTEENLRNMEEALTARELIKVGVQKNCDDDAREIAEAIAQHTQSELVQVIGRKIVLYREGEGDKKRIELPSNTGRRA